MIILSILEPSKIAFSDEMYRGQCGKGQIFGRIEANFSFLFSKF